eukprot:6201739-Pleurochrysis_carterae.AAC.2
MKASSIHYSVLARLLGAAPASSSIKESCKIKDEEETGKDDGELTHLRCRLLLVKFYSYGPITQGRGFELLTEADEARQASKQEKKEQKRTE